MTVKLAEALIQRADIQKRIASLKDRITRMAQVQEVQSFSGR